MTTRDPHEVRVPTGAERRNGGPAGSAELDRYRSTVRVLLGAVVVLTILLVITLTIASHNLDLLERYVSTFGAI